MPGPTSDIPDFAERFESAEPRGRPGPGLIVGALIAALASAALFWWLSAEDHGKIQISDAAPPAVASPAARPAPAPAPTAADPAQVRRAYDQLRSTYADGGAPALAGFSRECAEALSGDRRILDFCLAFDMYAASLAPETGEAAEWFRVGEARRLRLAREALPPGADPQARVAEVASLMGEASGLTPPPAPARAAERAPVSKAAPAPTRKAVRAAAVSRCRFEPTPARRVICANPDLQAADRRMQRAYRQAVAAGADPAVLDGEQAAWRTARNAASGRAEMADLYARRMRELAQHAAGR